MRKILCFYCVYGEMILKDNKCVGFKCDLQVREVGDVCTEFYEGDTQVIRGVEEY